MELKSPPKTIVDSSRRRVVLGVHVVGRKTYVFLEWCELQQCGVILVLVSSVRCGAWSVHLSVWSSTSVVLLAPRLPFSLSHFLLYFCSVPGHLCSLIFNRFCFASSQMLAVLLRVLQVLLHAFSSCSTSALTCSRSELMEALSGLHLWLATQF